MEFYPHYSQKEAIACLIELVFDLSDTSLMVTAAQDNDLLALIVKFVYKHRSTAAGMD